MFVEKKAGMRNVGTADEPHRQMICGEYSN